MSYVPGLETADLTNVDFKFLKKRMINSWCKFYTVLIINTDKLK